MDIKRLHGQSRKLTICFYPVDVKTGVTELSANPLPVLVSGELQLHKISYTKFTGLSALYGDKYSSQSYVPDLPIYTITFDRGDMSKYDVGPKPTSKICTSTLNFSRLEEANIELVVDMSRHKKMKVVVINEYINHVMVMDSSMELRCLYDGAAIIDADFQTGEEKEVEARQEYLHQNPVRSRLPASVLLQPWASLPTERQYDEGHRLDPGDQLF